MAVPLASIAVVCWVGEHQHGGQGKPGCGVITGEPGCILLRTEPNIGTAFAHQVATSRRKAQSMRTAQTTATPGTQPKSPGTAGAGGSAEARCRRTLASQYTKNMWCCKAPELARSQRSTRTGKSGPDFYCRLLSFSPMQFLDGSTSVFSCERVGASIVDFSLYIVQTQQNTCLFSSWRWDVLVCCECICPCLSNINSTV